MMQKVRVSQMGSAGWGEFGQNGQKLHENYKISIFGSKQRGGDGHGGQANFLIIGGGSPQSPPYSRVNFEGCTR